jgi:hypothetical protein
VSRPKRTGGGGTDNVIRLFDGTLKNGDRRDHSCYGCGAAWDGDDAVCPACGSGLARVTVHSTLLDIGAALVGRAAGVQLYPLAEGCVLSVIWNDGRIEVSGIPHDAPAVAAMRDKVHRELTECIANGSLLALARKGPPNA